ncbi:Ribonuclease 3 [Halotydeus destructor]|nr:Ribonuclease 3 [Halotydeus destructor]
MSTDDLVEFQKIIAYKFKDIKWLVRALTHKSFSSEHNERLEFIGDSILNNIISIKLYDLYAVREGDLTKLRGEIISNANLARIAVDKLKLQNYIRMDHTLDHRKPNYMADFLEALVGAIYEDSGSEVDAKQFVMQFCWDPSKLTESRSRSQSSIRPLCPTRSFRTNNSSHSSRTDSRHRSNSGSNRHHSQRSAAQSTSSYTRWSVPMKSKSVSTLNVTRTVSELGDQLKVLLVSEKIPYDDLKMVHGTHKNHSDSQKHSVTCSIKAIGTVCGWGQTLTEAKCSALSLMIREATQFISSTNRTELRLLDEIMSLASPACPMVVDHQLPAVQNMAPENVLSEDDDEIQFVGQVSPV